MRRSAVRLSILLLFGLACAGAPAAAAEGIAQSAHQEPEPKPSLDLDLDLDLDALHLSTFTDRLPGQEAANFQARAGDPVRRFYLLRNDGVLPLADVSVQDPDAAGATLHCGPSGTPTLSVLAPLSWASCSATFTAVTGKHRTTVTATATSPTFKRSLSGWTVAGYAAVEPGLQVGVSFGNGGNLPAGTNVPATVTITDTGTVKLHDLTPETLQLLSSLTCAPQGSDDADDSDDPDDSLVAELDPGESARCTATLATTPGTHSGSLTIAARWTWERPITVQGPQWRRVLTIRSVADTSYAAAPPLSNPVLQPRAAAPPPPSPSPVRTSPAAVVPRPSPSPTPTPSPTPSHAVLFGNPQYPVSHGLSLPLKVLAIIVVPAIAVGRRAASSLGRS